MNDEAELRAKLRHLVEAWAFALGAAETKRLLYALDRQSQEIERLRAEVERLTADLNTALGLEPDWKPLSQRYPEHFPSRDQR